MSESCLTWLRIFTCSSESCPAGFRLHHCTNRECLSQNTRCVFCERGREISKTFRWGNVKGKATCKT